jgi:hypothetical protein
MIVMALVACATEQQYTPKPASEIVAARAAQEVPGTCERLSPEQALTAVLDHELVEKLGPKVIAWAQEHPEQARMIVKAIERKAKEAIAKLREQLGRAERTFAQRCAGALEAAAIAHAAGSGTAVLEGRLLMPAGALPLAGAKVELAAADSVVATVTASACGRFRFERVPAGTYTLAFATRTFGGSRREPLAAATRSRSARRRSRASSACSRRRSP